MLENHPYLVLLLQKLLKMKLHECIDDPTCFERLIEKKKIPTVATEKRKTQSQKTNARKNWFCYSDERFIWCCVMLFYWKRSWYGRNCLVYINTKTPIFRSYEQFNTYNTKQNKLLFGLKTCLESECLLSDMYLLHLFMDPRALRSKF